MNLYTYHNTPEELIFYNDDNIKIVEKQLIVNGFWRELDMESNVDREGEDEIARSPFLSFQYAYLIKKGRFKKGEDILSTDARYSYYYADFLRKRFHRGEDIIAKNAEYAYKYARYVINGKWEKGEAGIAKSAEYSFEYAKYIIKDRFEKGEAVIKGTDHYQTVYLRFLKKLGIENVFEN